jgi:histidine triad (HIT) family protein
MDCTFCQIIKGDLETQKVFENDACIAFLDKHPINPGHLLVIPKVHKENFYEIDSENYSELFDVVKILAKKLKQIYSPKRVGVVIAGFDVPHAHIHVIPMHNYHDITSKSILEGKRSNPSIEELSIQQKLIMKED